jgi:hypothetical protein
MNITSINSTSSLNLTDSIYSTAVPCPNCVCTSIYGELAVFISSILLSVGGIFSILIIGCRKSNCTEIRVCGLQVKRANLEIDD